MNGPVKVLIVDDHIPFRTVMRKVLEDTSALTVIGEVQNGPAALAFIRQNPPDVVLLDLFMSWVDGIQTVAQINHLYPAVKIIIISIYDQQSVVLEALRLGASGYLIKGESSTAEIIETIQLVAAGQAVLNPRMTGWVLDTMYQRT